MRTLPRPSDDLIARRFWSGREVQHFFSKLVDEVANAVDRRDGTKAASSSEVAVRVGIVPMVALGIGVT